MDLAQVISERRAERRDEVRRKLEEDRHLIWSRNAKDENRIGPLDIFPREVWEKILGYLEAPEDIVSAQATCSLFDEILEGSYFKMVLFPRVLSVRPLLKALVQKRVEEEGKEVIEVSGLAKLRLVCKSWRDGVDHFFRRTNIEDNLCPSGVNPGREGDPGVKCITALDDDEGQLRLQKWTSTYFSFCGNEVVKAHRFFLSSISIHISLQVNQDLEGLASNYLRLLELIGVQVRRFSFSFWGHGPNGRGRMMEYACQEGYRTLLECLSHLRHLRWLELDLNLDHCNCDDHTSTKTVEFLALEEFILSRPLPPLKDLRKLVLWINTCWSSSSYESLILRTVISSNPEVSFLEARPRASAALDDDNLFHAIHSLPLLQSFTFSTDTWANEPIFFEPLVGFHWPHLRSFKLELRAFLVGTRASLIFRVLERLPTLQFVHLEFINLESWGGGPGYLELPNCTHFVYDVTSNRDGFGSLVTPDPIYLSVDFLFPMRKLEEFEWRYRSGPLTEGDARGEWDRELIQFKAGSMKMNESNIWGVFPALRRLVLYPPSRGQVQSLGAEEKLYFPSNSKRTYLRPSRSS